MMMTNSGMANAGVAMVIVDNLINNGYMQEFIRQMPTNMRHINIDPMDLADLLDDFPEILETLNPEIEFYTSWWRWSKAYAKTYTGNWATMHLNTRKIERDRDYEEEIASIAGTIAHEWGHLLEFLVKGMFFPQIRFNHGDNRRKDDTFQYQLGTMVKAYVKENLHDILRAIGSGERCNHQAD